MSTEVDNKQNPVVASEEAAKDKPAAEAPAVTVAAEEAKPAAAAAADNAGGDATKDEAATEPAKEEDAVAAAAPAEAAAAPAKPEPPVKYNVHRQNFEKDIVYLYQFSRTPVLPSLSPYCLKVETWLRLAGLKYEVSVLLSITATTGKGVDGLGPRTSACVASGGRGWWSQLWVLAVSQGRKSDSPVGGHFIINENPCFPPVVTLPTTTTTTVHRRARFSAAPVQGM